MTKGQCDVTAIPILRKLSIMCYIVFLLEACCNFYFKLDAKLLAYQLCLLPQLI
jgi:hypothetical protein